MADAYIRSGSARFTTQPSSRWRLHGILCRLDVEAVDDNALGPSPLHGPGHLFSTLLIHQGADEIQSCIHASAVSPSGYNSKATEAHRCTSGNRLTTCVGLLEGDASLSVVKVISKTNSVVVFRIQALLTGREVVQHQTRGVCMGSHLQ